jgi:hypothetical protein
VLLIRSCKALEVCVLHKRLAAFHFCSKTLIQIMYVSLFRLHIKHQCFYAGGASRAYPCGAAAAGTGRI